MNEEERAVVEMEYYAIYNREWQEYQDKVKALEAEREAKIKEARAEWIIADAKEAVRFNLKVCKAGIDLNVKKGYPEELNSYLRKYIEQYNAILKDGFDENNTEGLNFLRKDVVKWQAILKEAMK